MIIVDVREADEFEKEHIIGSINLPLSVLLEGAQNHFPTLPQAHILIMCRSGKRSQQAFDILVDRDILDEDKMTVFVGGLLRWKQEGNPTCAT